MTLRRQLDFVPFYLFIFVPWWVDVLREEDPLLILLSLPRTVMSFHRSDPTFGDEFVDVSRDVYVAPLELVVLRDAILPVLKKVVLEFTFVDDGIRFLKYKHAPIDLDVWIACRLLQLIDELFHRKFFENGLTVFAIVHPNDSKPSVFEVLDALLPELG